MLCLMWVGTNLDSSLCNNPTFTRTSLIKIQWKSEIIFFFFMLKILFYPKTTFILKTFKYKIPEVNFVPWWKIVLLLLLYFSWFDSFAENLINSLINFASKSKPTRLIYLYIFLKTFRVFEGIKNRSNLAEQLLRSGFPQYPPLRARSPDKSDQSTI